MGFFPYLLLADLEDTIPSQPVAVYMKVSITY